MCVFILRYEMNKELFNGRAIVEPFIIWLFIETLRVQKNYDEFFLLITSSSTSLKDFRADVLHIDVFENRIFY